MIKFLPVKDIVYNIEFDKEYSLSDFIQEILKIFPFKNGHIWIIPEDIANYKYFGDIQYDKGSITNSNTSILHNKCTIKKAIAISGINVLDFELKI